MHYHDNLTPITAALAKAKENTEAARQEVTEAREAYRNDPSGHTQRRFLRALADLEETTAAYKAAWEAFGEWEEAQL